MEQDNIVTDQNNTISNEDYNKFILEEQKKEQKEEVVEVKKISIKIPIIISIIVACVFAPCIIRDYSYTGYGAGGFGDLGKLFAYIEIFIAGAILQSTWFIYLLILTFQKHKRNEKNWFISLIIAIALFLLPSVGIAIFYFFGNNL